MLDKIKSGGQTAADQAAWRAAKAFGVPTGGFMPAGFATESGSYPEFARRHAAAELPVDCDLDCTEKNVHDSDATLWFGQTTTPSAHATVCACHRFGKPCMLIYPGASFEPSHVATWIAEKKFTTLNVAGNRETEEPGIGDLVERFLGEVLLLLGYKRA
jgi:hypothetical protein